MICSVLLVGFLLISEAPSYSERKLDHEKFTLKKIKKEMSLFSKFVLSRIEFFLIAMTR